MRSHLHGVVQPTGLPVLLLGMETRKVLQESKIPVLVDH
jgi:hypothetical protein